MAKKLDNKELDKVNGGALRPTYVYWKCNSCGNTWTSDPHDKKCPNCGSENIEY